VAQSSDAIVAPKPRHDRFSALGNPLYRRYWLGGFASVGATQLLILGQGWLVFELTSSPLYLGYLGAAASIPNIVMSLFGGAIADRFDKRLLLLGTSALISLLLLGLCLLDASGRVAVWHVLLISAAISFVQGFDWPARQSIFPLLIDREHMISAVALNSFVWQSTRMAMPAIGGILIAVSDTWVLFALGAAGFAAMFFVILSLDVNAAGKRVGDTLSSIVEGVRFIATEPIFRVLIPLTFANAFLGASYMQIMPAFAEMLDAGEQGYGYLISATGVGSVAGALLVGWFQNAERIGWIMLASLAVSACLVLLFAAATALFALSPAGLPVAICIILAASMANSIFMIASITVLQLRVPDELRGRAMGIQAMSYSMIPLGGLTTGALAALYSAPIAIAINIAVLLAIVLWVTLRFPVIRDLNGEHVTAAHSAKP
jgi:MFS family permease